MYVYRNQLTCLYCENSRNIVEITRNQDLIVYLFSLKTGLDQATIRFHFDIGQINFVTEPTVINKLQNKILTFSKLHNSFSANFSLYLFPYQNPICDSFHIRIFPFHSNHSSHLCIVLLLLFAMFFLN
ncbi:hypothetical protein BpHYR1_013554 [Brachionus plicatilis]|uniref:Uncharacterized protein n=1 Tax=Brachionus plicatilis TaxID=10195 RepID=A0A3M7QC25_BRAPC|nr:hypothetical protein BpHYR1_013554 [Brachionus plicatilis]